jgi:hypothetical protein
MVNLQSMAGARGDRCSLIVKDSGNACPHDAAAEQADSDGMIRHSDKH